ncbi:hypothetical protein CC79DRAFT_195414 [Sarocladium strictum]
MAGWLVQPFSYSVAHTSSSLHALSTLCPLCFLIFYSPLPFSLMPGIGILAHTPPTRLHSPHHTFCQVTLPVPTTDPQKPFPVSQRSLRTIFPPPSSIIRTTNHRRLFGKIQPHRPATAAVRDYDPICGTCAFTTETAFLPVSSPATRYTTPQRRFCTRLRCPARCLFLRIARHRRHLSVHPYQPCVTALSSILRLPGFADTPTQPRAPATRTSRRRPRAHRFLPLPRPTTSNTKHKDSSPISSGCVSAALQPCDRVPVAHTSPNLIPTIDHDRRLLQG